MRGVVVALALAATSAAASSAAWSPCINSTQCTVAGQACCLVGAPPAPGGGSCCAPAACVVEHTILGDFRYCNTSSSSSPPSSALPPTGRPAPPSSAAVPDSGPPWRDACASTNATVLQHCCNATHPAGCDLRVMRKPNSTNGITAHGDDDAHAARFAVDQPWRLDYTYTVPRHTPAGMTASSSTYYIWGDTDFDSYGVAPRAPFPLSRYIYNQIVPQLVLGNALASNDANYTPGWAVFPTWAVQAQYYWASCDLPAGRRCAPGHSRSYAQCGAAVNVSAGDVIATSIVYDPTDGAITASIGAEGAAGGAAAEGAGGAAAAAHSVVRLPRPFPNEQPPLFASWREFFEAAQRLSAPTEGPGVLSHPDFNIETHQVPPAELCDICPFVLARAEATGELGSPLVWWDTGEWNGTSTSAADVACAQRCLASSA